MQSDASGSELSIIVDILEYYVPATAEGTLAAAADLAALDVHVAEIVSDGDVVTILRRDTDVLMAKFPSGTHALGAVAKVRLARGGGEVGMLVTLVRLPTVTTDIVVTVNVPGLLGEARAEEIMRRICETLEVRQWELFGQES